MAWPRPRPTGARVCARWRCSPPATCRRVTGDASRCRSSIELADVFPGAGSGGRRFAADAAGPTARVDTRMCGIAGYVRLRRERLDATALRRMAEALAHRGPDGEGFLDDGRIGLAHRRLAIIDLSPGGAQPLIDGDL